MPILPNSIGIPKSTRILRTASPRSVALADDVSFSMENKCRRLRISVYQSNGNPSILPARIALDENTPNAVCLRNHWDHHHFQTKHMTQSKGNQSASPSDEHMLGPAFTTNIRMNR